MLTLTYSLPPSTVEPSTNPSRQTDHNVVECVVLVGQYVSRNEDGSLLRSFQLKSKSVKELFVVIQ